MNIKDTPCYLEVAEAQDLCLTQDIGRNLLDGIVRLQFVLVVHNVLHALDEPFVYLRQLFDAVHSIALFECLCKGKDAEVGRVGEFLIEVLELHMVVANEAVHALTNHSQALLQHLLEAAANAHNLSDGLHAGANLATHTRELGEVPARYLADEVVERRSHISAVRRTHLSDLVEGIAQGNLRCNECQGIARCLTCQS